MSDWSGQLPALMCAGAIIVLLLVPVVRRIVLEGLGVVESKVQGHIGLTALIVAVLGAAYLALTAIHQDRFLQPHWHDELSYVIQMRMLAQGKLWMPAHPVSQHDR